MGSSTDRRATPRSPQHTRIPRAPSPSTFYDCDQTACASAPPTHQPRNASSPPAYLTAQSPTAQSPATEPLVSSRLRYSAAYTDAPPQHSNWTPADSQLQADLIRKCLGATETGTGTWTKPRSDSRLKTHLPELLEHLLPLQCWQVRQIRPHLDFSDAKEYTRPSATDRTDLKAFKRGLEGLLMGPVEFDVWMVHEALWSGDLRDKDNLALLQLALLGRENGDLVQIKRQYRSRYRRRADSAASSGSRGSWRIGGGTAASAGSASTGELYGDWKVQSGRLEEAEPVVWQLFEAVLGGPDIETDYQLPGLSEATADGADDADVATEIAREVDDLRLALTSKPSSADLRRVARILGRASCARVRSLASVFEAKLHRPLTAELGAKVAKKDPLAYDMLVYIVEGALDRDRRDAMYIEGTMEGAGTRELQLACRIVHRRWRTRQVAKAWADVYPMGLKRKKNLMKYEKSLEARISGEVSGQLRDLLVGILQMERRLG